MPAVFVGHGSPMNALEDNRHTQAWREVGKRFASPSAILVISAHWDTRGTAITAAAQLRTLHDFHGFPPALFALNYAAPAAVSLVARVQAALDPVSVVADPSWGLDHGAWSVLLHMYPQAQIPVAQLSIDATQPAQVHYDLGRHLGRLRDEGVLILGTGNVVHDLRRIKWAQDATPYPWAEDFNDGVREALARGDHQYLVGYENLGESARLSVPTPEHYLPLLYVAGASRPTDTVTFPTDGIDLGSISMLSVLYS